MNREHEKRAMRRLYCSAIVVISISLIWWAISKTHDPAWYVIMVAIIAMIVYLVGIFLWAGLYWLARGMVRMLFPLLGRWIHGKPDIHRADWSDSESCRYIGPFREYILFGTVYYASGEGRKCNKCSAFKVERRVRIW